MSNLACSLSLPVFEMMVGMPDSDAQKIHQDLFHTYV